MLLICTWLCGVGRFRGLGFSIYVLCLKLVIRWVGGFMACGLVFTLYI